MKIIVSIVKFIQYSLLAFIAFVTLITYGLFLESIITKDIWGIYAVMVLILVVSYLLLIKWIAKYDISWYGVNFVTFVHMVVLASSMFIPMSVFLSGQVPESYAQFVFGSLIILILIICYFILRKWDIILIMRRRYYQPKSYSKADWYRS